MQHFGDAPGELGMHSDIKLYPNLNNKIVHLITAEITYLLLICTI